MTDDSSAASMPETQAKRLMELVSDFREGIKTLDKERQEEYLHGQREVADTRRRAQVSERLLRLRIR